jgi:hypothetical protein
LRHEAEGNAPALSRIRDRSEAEPWSTPAPNGETPSNFAVFAKARTAIGSIHDQAEDGLCHAREVNRSEQSDWVLSGFFIAGFVLAFAIGRRTEKRRAWAVGGDSGT